MIAAELHQAAQETRHLADRLGALKAMSQRQTSLAPDDAEGWAEVERRKQAIYDDLKAMALPDLFQRLRALADPADGDDAPTASARRRLAQSAEANIELMQEIAACEAEAEQRLAQGLRHLKQEAAAHRHVGELHRTYRSPTSPQPRFLDKRE